VILYTMMPQELIYPNDADAFSKQQTVTFQGVSLIVEQTDSQNVQVVRILSSDPQHYLDERICPGAKISCASIEGLSANF
jgi:hypothetical protein